MRRRLEVGGADGDADHAEVGEGQQRRRARQEREEAGAGARDVDEDHELAPVDAVDDVPGDRREDEDRQRLAEEHQRRECRRAGELQDEVEQRDGEKPVAAERDQRSEVEQPEIAVVREQAEIHSASS